MQFQRNPKYQAPNLSADRQDCKYQFFKLTTWYFLPLIFLKLLSSKSPQLNYIIYCILLTAYCLIQYLNDGPSGRSAWEGDSQQGRNGGGNIGNLGSLHGASSFNSFSKEQQRGMGIINLW